jgi:hypothetical protein
MRVSLRLPRDIFSVLNSGSHSKVMISFTVKFVLLVYYFEDWNYSE